MKHSKQHQFSKLQKSSIIFTQLGLVLTLLVVYLVLEHTSEKKSLVLDKPIAYIDEPTVCIGPAVVIERAKQPKLKKSKPKIILNKFKKVSNETKLMKQVLGIPTDIEIPSINIDSIVEVPPMHTEEKIIFILVENAPIFPGCEGLSKAQSKKCFTQRITKFVNNRFDTSLASESNSRGKQKIFVEFTIDKTGKVVDIIAKSPYKNLEKEAIRIINKLPKMTPGKQRTRAVAVKYTLPIIFEVY